MDLEDLFEGKSSRKHSHHKHHHNTHGRDEHHRPDYLEMNHHPHFPRNRNHDDSDLLQLGRKLLANKKLLILLVVVALLVLVLAAVLLLPLLGHAVDYVDKTGIKGVVERIWNGVEGGK